jgi:hypothetical protein
MAISLRFELKNYERARITAMFFSLVSNHAEFTKSDKTDKIEFMMYYLIEDPTLFIVLGIAIEAALGIALFRTGRGFLLWIMLGVLLVCSTGIIGQRFIITERKRVVQTLDGVAAALEENNVDKVFSYLTPDADFSRGEARRALSMIKIESANYSGLEIQINKLTSPMTAELKFLGVIKIIDPKGVSPYTTYPFHFKVIMRKVGDRWLISEHSIENERH